jgi:mono/diheme cytochrome c family protein
VNKQVIYIVYAHLMLATIAGAGFLVKNIPLTATVENNKAWCGNENLSSNTGISDKAQKGKTLFQINCASCHNLFKEVTGPSLTGFEDRGPWAERAKLYEWIKNPAAFMKKDSYAKTLKERYGSMMTAFPNLTSNEIDNIADYINNK